MADSLDRNSWDKPEEATPRSSSVGVSHRPQFDMGQPDESPELLRWRADSLLDEMMLGAVDVSAADAGSGADSPEAGYPGAGHPGRDGHGYGNGYDGAAEYSSYAARPTQPEAPYGGFDEPNGFDEPHTSREPQSNPYEHPNYDPNYDPNYGHNYGGHSSDGPYGFDREEEDRQNDDPYRPPYDPASRAPYSHDPYSHNGEPRFRDETERTHDNDREGGHAASLPPLSMPDLGPSSSAFQWREEKNSANGNGAHPHPADGVDSKGPESNGYTNGQGSGYAGPQGYGPKPEYTPPTMPPPRDGGRPEIRSGGLSDSTPRPSLSSGYLGSLHPVTGQSITGSPPPHTPAPMMGSSLASPTAPRVYHAGERYEQFAAEQNRQRAVPVDAQPPPETTKWEWQDFSQPTPSPQDETVGSSASAVVSGDAAYVSAMSVPGGKKRSTLLPRMTNVDAEAVNQEIATLHAELLRLLPNGHEAGERGRHLLEKAHSILQTDPMREAEVEYYMQQVRAIVQRVQQTRQWSDLYRDRLRLYLSAWMMLSLIVVAARVMFPIDVEAFLLGLTGGAASAALLAHYVGGLTATFAGSLGGAVGALATMVQHARREYGFFDRKYGLRGLMLPIIGWVFGALLYVVAALIFSLMGIVPAANLIAAAIPAVGAFLFGVSQESIYGTRS